MSSGERWTSAQFRDWIERMDFPQRYPSDARTTIPYDTKRIAEALGLKGSMILYYWHGKRQVGGVMQEVRLSEQTTKHCKDLLLIEDLKAQVERERKRWK